MTNAAHRGEPARHRVFVYGTLLGGESNHSLLARATFVGVASTEPGFALYSLGAYPGLVRRGNRRVFGELYEVDDGTLRDLDRLEGHPHFYTRTQIGLADGSTAETYLLSASHVRGRPAIVSGNWRSHRKEHRT